MWTGGPVAYSIRHGGNDAQKTMGIIAWFIAIPASGAVGALFYGLTRLF